MKVRLLTAWGQWSKGHVFPEMPGGVARTMIARGLAEEVRDAEPQQAVNDYMTRQMRPRFPRRAREAAR